MSVDQAPQRRAIGSLADVPVMQMGELAQARAPAAVRHAGQAEIDAIGEDHGQQRVAIVGRTARAPVCETVAEAGPRIDIEQDVRDFHARERSEEHTSELQSLMRISYAVFCLKKKKK